jgi:hypothetical protein
MKHLIYIIIVCSIFISCKRTSSGPSEPTDFLLKITVKKPSGETKPGLRINGGCLIANEQSVALGVLKLLMTAQHPDSGDILFRDSIYIVPVSMDTDQAFLGYTSDAGMFQWNDIYRFPGLLNLPSLKRTDESANNLGMFQISSIARLILVDTAAHQQQSFELNLKNGHNDFQLTWNPTTTQFSKISDDNLTPQLPQPKIIITTISSAGPIDTSWNNINISDAVGANRSLYLVRRDLVANPDYYELPPMPPGGSFDVRFISQRSLETYPVILSPDSAYRYRILIQSNHYPLTLRWKFQCPPEFHLSESIDGQAIDVRSICNKDSLKITNTAINGLTITIPKSSNPQADFKLYQNYPNPFSNSTIIRINLPVTAKITLSVSTLNNQIIGYLTNNESFGLGQYEIEYQPNNIIQTLIMK